jgi:hypothetical protein
MQGNGPNRIAPYRIEMVSRHQSRQFTRLQSEPGNASAFSAHARELRWLIGLDIPRSHVVATTCATLIAM